MINLREIEIHEQLNSKIWDENNLLRKPIRLKLLKIAKEFYSNLETDAKLVDVIFTGSLASYNYTSQSDLDLHLVLDFSKQKDPEHLKELFQLKAQIWNLKHDISIKGFAVEIYVQSIDEPHVDVGMYSVLKDEWIHEPKHIEITITDDIVDKEADKWMKRIDSLEKSLALSDNETASKLYNKLNKLKNKLKDLRKTSLAGKEGVFSLGNLVFKKLRNNGYIEKLMNAINKSYDLMYLEEHKI